MVEISRTGMRVETALAAETGQTVTATLVYRGEVVEIAGVVRWRREGGRDRAHEDLPFWEVGVAFTAVGEASADGIWRGLAAHDAPPI